MFYKRVKNNENMPALTKRSLENSYSDYGSKDHKGFEYEPNVDISYTYDYEKAKDRYKLTIIFNRVPNNFIYYKPEFETISSKGCFETIMIINHEISYIHYSFNENKLSFQGIKLNQPLEIYGASFNKVEKKMKNIIHLFQYINRDLNFETEKKVSEFSNFSYNVFLYDKKKKLSIQNIIELNILFLQLSN